MLCSILKLGMLRLPRYETMEKLLIDFLALHREERQTVHTGDYMVIVRHKEKSDDFVHALNFGLCGIYKVSNRYPNMSIPKPLAPETIEAVVPQLGSDAVYIGKDGKPI